MNRESAPTNWMQPHSLLRTALSREITAGRPGTDAAALFPSLSDDAVVTAVGAALERSAAPPPRATVQALRAENGSLELFSRALFLCLVPPSPAPAFARYQAAHPPPIAVTGMSARLPGGAASPERFWALLRNGRDAVKECDRWESVRLSFSVSIPPFSLGNCVGSRFGPCGISALFLPA